ncbi:MAG: helix-turn-helix transcriptional regulator [Paenarthrobacter ureafaciens]|uniref:helix-turn-helix domain-containing protein n=1 Tax=Paenarthrobacter ureafaciens TaxID=37931 RepID=UPI001AD433F8|nr:helix-turn-helix transcriptional regulator [Paenarthrobacter ureafaciens]MBN9128263.1 helix-turn-helix transcriptional regulator [Paenarthrobacter ureafaciens]
MLTGERIGHALKAAQLSQRAAADTTGISQPTLSRIINGERAAKVPELLAIAAVTGYTFAELTGQSRIAERAQVAARATAGVTMEQMRSALLRYLELDAYLDDQGITAS